MSAQGGLPGEVCISVCTGRGCLPGQRCLPREVVCLGGVYLGVCIPTYTGQGVSVHGGVCPWGCLPMGVSAHGGVCPWGCLLGVCIPACTQQGIGVCIPACTGHRSVYPSMHWAVGVCLGVSAQGGCLLMGVSAHGGVCLGCLLGVYASQHALGMGVCIPALGWVAGGVYTARTGQGGVCLRGCVCLGRVSAQGVSTQGICPGMAAWGGFLPRGCLPQFMLGYTSIHRMTYTHENITFLQVLGRL